MKKIKFFKNAISESKELEKILNSFFEEEKTGKIDILDIKTETDQGLIIASVYFEDKR